MTASSPGIALRSRASTTMTSGCCTVGSDSALRPSTSMAMTWAPQARRSSGNFWSRPTTTVTFIIWSPLPNQLDIHQEGGAASNTRCVEHEFAGIRGEVTDDVAAAHVINEESENVGHTNTFAAGRARVRGIRLPRRCPVPSLPAPLKLVDVEDGDWNHSGADRSASRDTGPGDPHVGKIP